MSVRRTIVSAACLALVLALVPAQTRAQSLRVGPNVNMVSGTSQFTGDPWLQRQNEPSIAVSTRNPCHLLAGANDYRTVDMPGLPDDGKETGDAWLGLFKSFDCGRTWKTGLVHGFPQDNTAEGASSPLFGLAAGADPIVRAGTNGLFFYSGIAFNRGAGAASKVFVARYIDDNDQTADKKEDSIDYVGTTVVDTGTTGQFADKPYLVVDIPRGKKLRTCTVNGQTFGAGNVYVAWTRFVGDLANQVTKLMVARSLDCGGTFDKGVKVSEGYLTNQGATMAIDPTNGAIYVAWRQYHSDSGQDAILVAKSTDNGATFSKGTLVSSIDPFDQGTSVASFRTVAYPTMAVDGSGKAYVAWSQRGVPNSPGGDARIVMSTSTNGANWTPFVTVDNQLERGHQIMPAMIVAGGRLQIVYYDLRDDHTYLTYEWDPPNADAFTYPYKKVRNPAGDLADPANPANVFWDFVVDGVPPPWFPPDAEPLRRRHTIEVQAAQLDLTSPGAPFVTGRLSEYALGTWAPAGAQGDVPAPIVQMQFNPPNLPLYAQGESAFIGDYVDVAALSFLRNPDGSWKFNTAAGPSAPLFHAVWTDNRDVSPPPQGKTWKDYQAPKGGQSCAPGTTGMRNANIYTAAILPPLVVGSLDNSKRLNATKPRAFPVFVQNTTADKRHYVLTIQAPAGVTASFVEVDLVVDHVYVTLPPMSGAARTVYVKSADAAAQVTVDVKEVLAPADPVTLAGTGVQGAVLLNPDPLSPAIMNPAIMNDTFNPAIMNRTISNPAIMNPDIMNPDVMNPAIMNPADPAWALINPAIMNPAIMNPDVMNPDIMNPAIMNPAIMNPDIMNPDVMNPAIMNPAIMNPAIMNGTLGEAAIVTDTTWTIRNDGNAAGSYSVKLTLDKPLPTGSGYYAQLILHKRYLTPGAATVANQANQSAACALGMRNDDVVLANVTDPQVLALAGGGYQVNDPAIMNLSMALAPGELGFVTLRIVDPNRLDNVVTYDPGSGRYYNYDTNFDTTKDIVVEPVPQPINEPPLPAGTTLGFSTQPTDTVAGQPVTPAVRVSVSPVPAAPARVTLSLMANGNAGILHGTLSADTDAGGVATFSDLQVSTVGAGYQLLASVPGSTAVTSQAFNVVGGGPVVITTAALPHNTLRDPYNATILTSGGTGSTTFTITAGALPPGLTLGSTGTVSGTPTRAGDFSVTVRVADSSVPPLFVTQSYTLRIFAVEQRGFSNTPVDLTQFGGGIQRVAQIFTNNAFGLLNGVRLAMSCQGGGTATATAAIHGVDGAGQIHAAALSSGSMSIPTGSHVPGYRYLIPLTAPVPVGPGQRLAMVLNADASCSIEQASYAFGDGYWNTGGGWTYLEADLAFETLITPPAGLRYPVNEHHAGDKAIALADGRILILPSAPLVAAEIYDPATNLFTAAGSLTTARTNYTATLLADGHRVLVAGGVVSGNSTTSTEVFDASTGISAPAAGLHYSRGDHTATLLPGGAVLIAGGHSLSGGVYADVLIAEIFDSTGTVSDAATMGTGRHSHTATLLATNDKVLFAGGNPQTGPTPTAVIYDIATGTFTGTYYGTTNGMLWQRAEHTATLLNDGRVLLVGGASVYGTLVPEAEVFDPSAGTFSAAGTLLAPRLWHTATALADGSVMVIGGRTSYANQDMGLASVERWSPTTGRFTGAGALLIGRMAPATARLADGTILVYGGDGSSTLAVWAAERFNPAAPDLLLTMTPAVLPDGSLGVPYPAVTLAATGGSGGYVFSIANGSLPPGLSLAGDLIAGTPSGIQPGSWVFTVEVRDSSDHVNYQTLSIRIDPLAVTTTSMPTGVVGVPYSAPLAATGAGSITWTIEGTLPDGLVLNEATGVISGTPTTPGPHAFFAVAHDSFGHQATRELGVQIAVAGTPDTLTFTTVPPRAVGGQAFAVDVSARSGGIAVPGAAVTLGFSNNPGGNPAPGLTAFADALGIAHFSSVVITRGGYGYSLVASSGAVSSAPSASFDVVGFSNGPAFIMARTGGFTATKLRDGRILVVGGNSDPGGFACTSSAELYDPVAGTIQYTDMTYPRLNHTATLLADGRVLITGGYCGGPALDSAEIYTPVAGGAGSFSSAGTMISRRETHTATLLGDGRVLIAGGYEPGTASYLSSAELYDPTTGFTPTAAMPAPVGSAAATLLPSGRVLIAGGANATGATSDACLYDPGTASFIDLPNMATPRYAHTATLMNDGWVLVAGGTDGGTVASSAELYDPGLGTAGMFRPANGAMMIPRQYHTATLLPSGEVLVAGGSDGTSYQQTAELFNPVSGTFVATGPLSGPRAFAQSVLTNDGQVLVTEGGASVTSGLWSSEIYHPADPPYTTAGLDIGLTLTTPRSQHTATRLMDGRVLIVGGSDASGNALTSAEICDPAAWYSCAALTATLTTARANHTATLLPNGKVLIAGGWTSSTAQTTTAELFDPAGAFGAGSFTPTGSMNALRIYHTATLLPNGKVLVLGGNGVRRGEVYDPSLGTFTLTPGFHNVDLSRYNTATLLPDGRVWISGTGATSDPFTDFYNPTTGLFASGPTLGWRTAAEGQTATLLANGTVLVAGGFTVTAAVVYNPSTGIVTKVGDMSGSRCSPTATLLPNGKVLFVGGAIGPWASGWLTPGGPNPIITLEMFDPATGLFSVVSGSSLARLAHTATALSFTGQILLAGGVDASTVLNTTYRYRSR